MADRMSETEERLAFIRRTKLAREARYDTQNPICELLGIPQGKYKHYEKRTPLPYRFILKFCLACDIDILWLLTGEEKYKGPVTKVYPSLVQEKRPRGRKPRVQAA